MRILSPRHADRQSSPADVWDYGNFDTWQPTAWSLAETFIDAAIRAEFLRAPPEYVVSDDLSWLDAIIRRTTGELIDSKLEMTALLQAHYTAIRACHATNTADVDAYYHHGLLPLDPGVVHDRA